MIRGLCKGTMKGSVGITPSNSHVLLRIMDMRFLVERSRFREVLGAWVKRIQERKLLCRDLREGLTLSSKRFLLHGFP